MKFRIVLVEGERVGTVAVTGHLKTAIADGACLGFTALRGILAETFDAVDAFMLVSVGQPGQFFDCKFGRQLGAIGYDDCAFHAGEIDRTLGESGVEV